MKTNDLLEKLYLIEFRQSINNESEILQIQPILAKLVVVMKNWIKLRRCSYPLAVKHMKDSVYLIFKHESKNILEDLEKTMIFPIVDENSPNFKQVLDEMRHDIKVVILHMTEPNKDP